MKCLFIFDVLIVFVTQWVWYKYTEVSEERAASILRCKSAFFIKTGTSYRLDGVKSCLCCALSYDMVPISELCSCGVQSGSDQYYDKPYALNRPLNQNVFDRYSYIINFMLTVSKHNIFVNSTQARPVRHKTDCVSNPQDNSTCRGTTYDVTFRCRS
jgi:hypothetical protein